MQPKPNAVVTKELKWRKKLHEQKGYIPKVENRLKPIGNRTHPQSHSDSKSQNLRKKHDRINTYTSYHKLKTKLAEKIRGKRIYERST